MRSADDVLAPARSTITHFDLGLVLAATFLVVLNENIMGVALPRVVVDLHVPIQSGAWLTTGFMLVLACVIPATGFLSNRFSLRLVFAGAMTLFAAGTALATFSWGFGPLLAGRMVQACGTAVLLPLLNTVAIGFARPGSRGRVMGVVGLVMAGAPALGPSISGVVLSTWGWRWIFGLVLPIAALLAVAGAFRLGEGHDRRPARFDYPSVLLSTVGMALVVFGLARMADPVHVATLWEWMCLVAAGLVALGGFVLRQRWLDRHSSPLLDLRVFRSSRFAVSTALFVLSFAVAFGVLNLTPLLLQGVLGLSPLHTAMLMLPGALVGGLVGPFAGRIFDRRGAGPLLAPGTLLVAGGVWGLASGAPGTPIAIVATAQVCVAIGVALSFPVLVIGALGALPDDLRAHGSATLGTLQHLAGAVATAVLVSVAGAGAPEGPIVGVSTSGVHTAFRITGFLSGILFLTSLWMGRKSLHLFAPRQRDDS